MTPEGKGMVQAMLKQAGGNTISSTSLLRLGKVKIP